MSALHVPTLPDDADALKVALAFAEAGWFVGPARRNGDKHPGGVLGTGWPGKTSRDPHTIVSWFAGTDHVPFLHVGRSGAVAFDVDKPDDALPAALAAAERDDRPPTQFTRPAGDAEPWRRHLVFARPDGRHIGNGGGRLGTGWGEVRGANGIIRLAPRGRWTNAGQLPALPWGVLDELPSSQPGEHAADPVEVEAFAAAHPGPGTAPGTLAGVVRTFERMLADGQARHNAGRDAACMAAREVRAGRYGAGDAVGELRTAYVAAMGRDRPGGRPAMDARAARADFTGLWSWAVGQVAHITRDEAEARCAGPATAELGARKLTSSAPAPVAADTAEDPADLKPDSWAAVDLGPFLRGEVTPQPPAVGISRDDGVRLLYRGLEHVLIGESEAGKSWLALACVAAELVAGNRVVYVHFEESSAADTITRLMLLDVPASRILAGLDFVAPEGPVHPAAVQRYTEVPPSLVVLDGVNEGMALHGLDIMKPEGPAAWRRLMVKPFTAVGAAVLGLDHVVKDREQRGQGYALGSAHKINGVNGAALLLENREPFGKGRRGRSSLYVVKDRPGELRRHGRATPTPRKFHLAELVVDAESGLRLDLYAGRDQEAEQDEGSQYPELDAVVLAAVLDIDGKGIPASQAKVCAAVPRRDVVVRGALERLVLAGQLDESGGGPGKARIFTPASSEDQESASSRSTSSPSTSSPIGDGTRSDEVDETSSGTRSDEVGRGTRTTSTTTPRKAPR